MIALILLLAAPERVVIVAKPAEKPSIFHKIGQSMHRLWEKEDKDVARGNALNAEGKLQEALKEYDKARERLPDSPALSLNRAGTLLKIDPKLAPDAAAEASQALQHGEGKVKPEAAYDLALATEAMGKADDAMKAYAGALALDPDDEDSKVNLELLLKTQEERKKSIPQQQEQSKEQNQQKDQQENKQKGDDQQKQEQKDAGNKEQKQQQQPQQAKQEEKKEKVAEEEKPVDRSEAERLLDALRAGEKNLQVWRFAKDKRKEARRSDAEKDW